MQSYTVRVRERGQLTIPQAAREELDIKEGDTLTLIQIEGLLVLEVRQPLVPQLSEQFSRQMDEAGVSLADLLIGLEEERRASGERRFGANA
ncbi:MAG: AbrB/MazE/SpoVT family DNA-binding domain-containing protein [Anaerolineales bacterium]|nr:AbrB/MazE/SpoVT family DNA-binding domain-containing protein [Anaerolineales bacterium]